MGVHLPPTLDRVPAVQPPDACAIRFEGRDVSYGELNRLVTHAAGALHAHWQVREGDRVAWLGGNHVAQLVLLFALARLGALLVPLNFRLAPAEWDAQLQACTPGNVVHDAAWADAARELARRNGLQARDADSLLTADDTPRTVIAHARPDAAVLLVHTSGTTGGPKAAVHTQANLLANMRIAAQVQQLGPADRVLTVLPLFHVGGLCIQTLPALGAGAQVLLHSRFSVDDTLAAIAQERPTLTLQVPATMKALIEHPDWPAADLSSLRAVWAGSSLLPAPLVQAFHARGIPLCNVYGATETGPFSIALGPARAMSHAGSCGWPAPEVEVRMGEAGEVLLRAPNVVQRYWPDQPACDAQGWFHTGDLATCAADGSYTIVGRAKELIISGGENIHPAEVEAALAEHPDIAECAAFGMPHAQWGEIVAVAVVLREDAGQNEEALRAHLALRLARFKLPRQWLWLDALPKTALGKVQRGVLASMARAP